MSVVPPAANGTTIRTGRPDRLARLRGAKLRRARALQPADAEFACVRVAHARLNLCGCPALWTTSAHLVRSARIKPRIRPGRMGKGSPPHLFQRCRHIRQVEDSLTSSASFSMMAVASRGANSPCQPVASKPGMVSPIVGKSGAAATRCVVVTPSARTSRSCQRPNRRHAVDCEIDLAAEHRGHFIRRRAERDVSHGDAGRAHEHYVQKCEDVPLPDEP